MRVRQKQGQVTFILLTSIKFTGVLVVAFTPFMAYHIDTLAFEEAVLLGVAFITFLMGLVSCQLLSQAQPRR